jgi:SAM-dependent methyltransferase
MPLGKSKVEEELREICLEHLPLRVSIKFPQYVHNVGFYYFTPYQILLDLILGKLVKPNSVVLDAGCGSKSLIPKGANNVAIDILRSNVQNARKKQKELNYVCANLENLPFISGCFDIAFSKDVLEHCNSKIAINELGRVLKEEGKLIASTSNLLSPIMLIDQLFSSLTNRIANTAGTNYYHREKHLSPYALRFELAYASLYVEKLYFVTIPPLLSSETWREFVSRFPRKLIPWLFISVGLTNFRIFREMLVVRSKKRGRVKGSC